MSLSDIKTLIILYELLLSFGSNMPLEAKKIIYIEWIGREKKNKSKLN